MSAGDFGNGPFGAFAVIWNPVSTMRRVAREGRALPGFVVISVVAAVGLLTNVGFALGGITRRRLEQAAPVFPPGSPDTFAGVFEVATPLLAVITPFVGWVVVSLMMRLVTRLFNGTGTLPAMLGVVGVAQAPALASIPISIPLTVAQTVLGPQNAVGVLLGYLTSLVGVAFFFWHLVLVVIGAAHASSIGYGESAGSCAITCVGVGILLLVAGVLLGIGVALSMSAVAPR